MTTVKREPAAPPGHELEALIQEARARQRRRHRLAGVAVLLAAAAGAGAFAAFGGGGNPPPPPGAHRPPQPTAASPAAIQAFVARAQRAFTGTFSVTYQITAAAPARARASRRHAEVAAAQRSRTEIFYRETPSFDGISRSHSYEVFVSRPGIFSCTRTGGPAPWLCQGPYRGTGMGTMGELLGPYPPQALVLGLQNAAEAYTGALSHSPGAATSPEPAYLLTRRLAGRTDRCLAFGGARHPLGSVCLAPNGVIAYYSLSARVTDSIYQTADLRSYSHHVKAAAFALPAKPAPAR